MSVSGERYECSWPGCTRRYTTPGNLRTHERTHTGQFQFRCENCSKPFLSSYALKVHVRIHTQERPFICEYLQCLSAFNTLYRLNAHRRIHTGNSAVFAFFGSARSSGSQSVCLSGTSLSKALNLHLSLISLSQVSLTHALKKYIIIDRFDNACAATFYIQSDFVIRALNPISPGTFNPICAGKLHLCNCRVGLFKLNFLIIANFQHSIESQGQEELGTPLTSESSPKSRMLWPPKQRSIFPVDGVPSHMCTLAHFPD